MESSESLLKKALLLKPQDRFLLIDGLIRSLDEPDKKIDEIWSAEAEKRLKAHREGKTRGVTFKDVFGEEL
jgi:putative addiction module component (TIGR02574 family)